MTLSFDVNGYIDIDSRYPSNVFRLRFPCECATDLAAGFVGLPALLGFLLFVVAARASFLMVPDCRSLYIQSLLQRILWGNLIGRTVQRRAQLGTATGLHPLKTT